MEVICLQEDAFYSIVDKVIAHVRERTGKQDKADKNKCRVKIFIFVL